MERQIFGGVRETPQRFLVPHCICSLTNSKAGSGSSKESSPGMEETASPGPSTAPLSGETFSFHPVGISLITARVCYLVFSLRITEESFTITLLPFCGGKLQLDPT